ncbi:DNA primase [Gordonia phage GMA6]|uniref:Zinc finger CHC2-type domain-containing protein n=1 Tax=Gordonia phage GMA6 TaxID=1647285 RepID=A0A0K0NLA3_9CAUD|nr:DNA primase [Gordonia phage GMA6]AKL88332.1 hypothetical protein GMA6_51 [Gordonia phage GMA6]
MNLSQHKYGNFAERYLNVHTITGSEALALCPFHEDHSPSFQFNLDKGLYVCFSCGASGSIRGLESRFGVSYRSMGVGLDVLYRAIGDLERPVCSETRMSEDQLAQFSLPSRHWSDRGFEQATVDKFDLGYDVIRDAMTIPIRDMNGELIGLCRRYLDPDMRNRYRYPKGFHKREHLFGSWLVADMPDVPSVALTEGAIDAMTVWQSGVPAMAIYGSSVSSDQIKQLRMLGVRKITMFFDNDRAGQEVSQRCLGWKRDENTGKWIRKRSTDLRRWFEVSTVDWTTAPRKAKDANDLSQSTIQKMLAEAKVIR